MLKELLSSVREKKYKESVRKAEKWLAGIQNPDGSIDPVDKGLLLTIKYPAALK